MKAPAPYTFPHKSRAAIAAYLDRDGRAYNHTRFRFCWNVKAYSADFDGDTMREHLPELEPAFDSAWSDYLESHPESFWNFCENAARWVAEGDWCSYPGDDQGEWAFSFAGRSGGWLVLIKWRGRKVSEMTGQDFLDPELWPWADLVAFYRGIRCADSDFTPAKAAEEVECQAAAWREHLESEWKADRKAAAQAMADSIQAARPDLAPCY